jgi:hypothetical protein
MLEEIMFELLIVGAAILFGGIYFFKFIFLFLGLILTGVGFIFKAVITIILAIVFFPVTLIFAGGLISSGIIGILLVFALLGALSERRREEKYNY